MDFVPNTFVPLVAVNKFHLGKLAIDLAQGAIVQFDGQVLKIGNKEYDYPELRSAVKSGWLTETGTNTAVASVTPRFPVSNEERSVGTVDKARSKVSVSVEEKKPFKPSILKEDEGDNRSVGPAKKPDPYKSLGSDVGGAEQGVPVARFTSPAVSKLDLNDPNAVHRAGGTVPIARAPVGEDSVVVGRIKTSSKEKMVIADARDADRAIRKIEAATSARIIPSTDGKDVHAASSEKLEDIIGVLDPASRAKMAADQRKLQVAKSEQAQKPQEPETMEVEPTPVVVAPKPKLRKPQSVEEVIVNGDEVELAPGVRWNKKLHWRTRAKIAVEQFRDNPTALALIKAYEEKSVSALIDEHLAKLNK